MSIRVPSKVVCAAIRNVGAEGDPPDSVAATNDESSKHHTMPPDDCDGIEDDLAKAHLMERIVVAESERRGCVAKDAFASLAAIELGL